MAQTQLLKEPCEAMSVHACRCVSSIACIHIKGNYMSTRGTHACSVPGCPMAFSTAQALHKHECDHKRLRRDVNVFDLLRHATWSLPAAHLCAAFVDESSALACLNVRITDMSCHEARQQASIIIPLLSKSFSRAQLHCIRKRAATWSFEDCLWTKRLLERVIARLVTCANGRRHPINAKHRKAAFEELNDLLLDVWGMNWNHRGLR